MRMRNMAQIALAKAAYPTLEGNALMQKRSADGWSSRFSDYFDDPSNVSKLVGIDSTTDPAALRALLEAITSYKKPPDNLH